MATRRTTRPSWDLLFAIADSHDGYFTLQQAAEAGYSPQLLQKHLRAGRIERTSQRGIYRLVHYPSTPHENLSVVWLWSKRQAVFSHETALWIYRLTDILPHKVFVTLPASMRTQRTMIPPGVFVAYDDLPSFDRAQVGSIPVTTPRRTLLDCAKDQISPEFLQQAVSEALQRSLVAEHELPAEVRNALSPYAGQLA